MSLSSIHGPRMIVVLVALLGLVAVGSTSALAQKSQKTQTAPARQTTLKEVLAQYQGKDTNLGKLVKLSGDYFTVENAEGEQSMHPYSVIHTLKVVKPEEGSTIVLEIILVDKD